MAESWRERLRREAREIDEAVRAVLARKLDDDQLRTELEALAQKPHFASQTYRWGPIVYERNRVLFRPFVLAHFGGFALDAKGNTFDAWRGATAPALEAWLTAVDAADDVELTKRLYGWRLIHVREKERLLRWHADVLRRFTAAKSPADRHIALAKVDTWLWLDAKTAEELYAIDPAASRKFILAHVPFFGAWSKHKPRDWHGLLTRTQDDHDFHFALYRRLVEGPRWRSDVLDLAKRVRDPAELDRELERRHPRTTIDKMAEVFDELVRSRERDVVPYIMRHAASVFPRWFFGQRQAKGLTSLLGFANERGWFDLWASLLRTSSTREVFDAEILRLVKSKLADDEVRGRLALIAGPGREMNFPGVSFGHVQPLVETTAVALYQRFPDLVRGAFRMHVAPIYGEAYAKLVELAIAVRDTDLVDYFASRLGMQGVWPDHRATVKTVAALAAHYEALPDAEFIVRATNALSRMPAFAIWNYDEMLRQNPLARLLFERSTPLYLGDASAVRDLLESPQIHVQMLAFRVLGGNDPRAAAIAAGNADLLQATLFRPLHTRTRLFAFRAIERAANHDETTARYLLGRMREALALPEKRYPVEKLIGLIAKVLARWPALRAPSEVPHVFEQRGRSSTLHARGPA